MGNRRRPTRLVPLDGGPTTTTISGLPPMLQNLGLWTDTPPAQYRPQTLDWIVAAVRRGESMRLNAWRCETCQLPFIAYDRHPGTTPMLVSHRAFAETAGETDECTGMCASVFYSREGVIRAGVDLGQGGQQIRPSHEWYRPSADELRRETGEVRSHVRQGGLLLRAVIR
jgi:hypothetical protein